MRNTNLFEAIGEIDDKKIADALAPVPITKRYNWIKIASFAACFVVIIGGVIYGLVPKQENGAKIAAPESAETGEVVESSNVEQKKLLKIKEKISAAKRDGELSFVESVKLHNNSQKLRITVNTQDEEVLKNLLAYDENGDHIEIEFAEEETEGE
ncbi:MAG: hypothetical protein E7473_11085 [Ruminococcaceae bacterium]|nr:hypothetical protein [Oscillospiraceae bacterium]